MGFTSKLLLKKAGVVVKGSACSPSAATIRAQIPLMPTVFSVQFVFEKNGYKHKIPRVGPLIKFMTSKAIGFV